MKIRQLDSNTKIGITICEECKKIRELGIFLTLGFFNGFICSECAANLEMELVYLSHQKLNKLLEKEKADIEPTLPDPGGWPDAPQSHRIAPGATFVPEVVSNLDSRVTTLESGLKQVQAILDSGLPQSISRAWKEIETIQSSGRNRGNLGGNQ